MGPRLAVLGCLLLPLSAFLGGVALLGAGISKAIHAPSAGPYHGRAGLAAAALLVWEGLMLFWVPDPALHALGILVRTALWLGVAWVGAQAIPASWRPRVLMLLVVEAALVVIVGLLHQAGLLAVYGGLVRLPRQWRPDVVPPYLIELVLLPDPGERLRSLFASPLSLGVYLATLLPIGVGILLGARQIRSRLLAGAAALTLVVGIAVTQTRNAWLWGAIATLTLLAGSRNWRVLALAAGSGVAVFGALAALQPAQMARLAERAMTIPSFSYGSNAGRLAMWRTAVEDWLGNPILGSGHFSYFARFPGLVHNPHDISNRWPHLHDWYLHQAVETGLVGALLLFAVIGVGMVRAVRTGAPREFDRLALLAGTVAFLGMGIFDYPVYDGRNAILFWLLWGMLARPGADLSDQSGSRSLTGKVRPASTPDAAVSDSA